MTREEISQEIVKLLKIANDEGILFECFCDIDIMWEQSDDSYWIDDDYDSKLDIINR